MVRVARRRSVAGAATHDALLAAVGGVVSTGTRLAAAYAERRDLEQVAGNLGYTLR